LSKLVLENEESSKLCKFDVVRERKYEKKHGEIFEGRIVGRGVKKEKSEIEEEEGGLSARSRC